MFRYPVAYIRAPRLSGYDYSSAGAYFVTICAFRRMMLFGQVVGDAVALNPVGEAAAEGWSMLPRLFARVYVDSSVVMPNRVHAIVVLPGAGDAGGGSGAASTKVVTLSRVINAYKSITGRSINILRGTPGAPVWQRSFYDHIVRDDNDLNRIREYILTNPLRWSLDEENPDREPPTPDPKRRSGS